jgi:TP901 family phage tail tape measure protein
MAAELEAGRAFVDLVPRLQAGFGNAVDKELDGPLGRIKGKVGGLGKAIGLGLGAGVAAGAGALYAASLTIDGALDTIRLKTGQTGETLAGLETSFRNVGRTVPDDLGKVGQAIGELNQRTGLTGAALETLATQELALARITDSDLGATIETTTRLFGDWSVATADQGKTLDELFRASQATGVGVNDLSASLVQFGGPLRQLGFSLQESAALIGKFEKEGVNTELVLGSLRIALGKMAKAGEAPAATLQRTIKEIKNAGDAGKANALALELFGARAGPDMAAAIREGRFEVDSLVKTISGGKETILGAAADTDDAGEAFARLKNKVILAVEPLAGRFLNAVTDGIEKLEPFIVSIGDRLPGAFDAVERAVTPVFEAIGKIAGAFKILLGDDGPQGFGEIMDNLLGNSGKYVGLFRSIGEWILKIGDFIRAHLKPILIGLGVAFVALTSPISLVVGALVLAYAKSEVFRNVLNAVIVFIATKVVPGIAAFVGYFVEQFGNVIAWIKDNWGQISEAIGHVVEVVSGIIRTFVDVISALWRAWGDDIANVVGTIFDYIKRTIENVVSVIQGIIKTFLAILNGDWGKAWDGIKQVVGAVWDQIKNIIGSAVDVVKSIIGGLASTVVEVAKGIWEPIKDGFKAVINWIIRAWNGLEFKIPGFDPPGPGPSFGGFTLGVPNIKELAGGGTVVGAGLSIVGEGRRAGELLALPRGATAVPLDVARMIADAAGGRRGGFTIEHLEVPTAVDATADEVVDAIGAKLGWKLTTRRDR